MKLRDVALAAALGALATGHLQAQTSAVVDEGTFMIARKGTAIGRESFRITRAPGSGGQVFRAESRSSLGDLRFLATLSTDSSGSPVAYEMRQTQRGEQVEVIQGRGRPDRFSLLVQTKGGEAGGEYRLRRGTVLLDDQMFHQFYFLAMAGLAAADSVVTVISPRDVSPDSSGRDRSRTRNRLEFRGIESVAVGGQSLTGRRFAVMDSALTRAELWIDAAGRLLKVSVPEKTLIALRDDPPR